MGYVESGYVDSSYFEGSTSNTVTNCDLTEVNNLLNFIIDKINANHLAVQNNFDTLAINLQMKLDSLISSNNAQSTFLTTLGLKVDSKLSATAFNDSISTLAKTKDITALVPVVNDLSSLNGNGSEYKDGQSVSVYGRNTVYQIERSFYCLYSDNSYTIHYDLLSLDGYKITVPEALLTLVV